MKNSLLIISKLLTIASLLFVQSCDLLRGNDPKPKTELEKLPPITQGGKNTFGCLVNGKAFVVTNTSMQWAIFQQGQLEFGANDEYNDLDQSINMILGDPLEEGIEYSFIDPSLYYHSGYSLRIGDTICIYEFDNTFEGSIIFTKIDRINFTISGTFEFSTVTSTCETIRITNGRFDLQYIP